MATLFEIQKSEKGIKYGTKLTGKQLEKAFGVKGSFSRTTSSIDGTSFLFYGKGVRGEYCYKCNCGGRSNHFNRSSIG